MAGCPVHIWAPMMAAALPFTRVIRDRVRAQFTPRSGASEAPPRELHRWAPVGQANGAAAEETAPLA